MMQGLPDTKLLMCLDDEGVWFGFRLLTTFKYIYSDTIIQTFLRF